MTQPTRQRCYLICNAHLDPVWLWRWTEGQAEALTGTFKTQDMANTLWAYAKMGREPGVGRPWTPWGRSWVELIMSVCWTSSLLPSA